MKLFRVWVYKTKCYDPDRIIITNGNPFEVYIEYWESYDNLSPNYGIARERLLSPDEYVLEFSLQHKDKNGKMIFEGDICVERYTESWIKRCNKSMPKVHYYLCEKDSYGVGLCLSSFHKYPFHEDKFVPHISQDIEVVGNIHENPELLNEYLDNEHLLERICK